MKVIVLFDTLYAEINLLKQGKIKPIISARMLLNQAAQAHELLTGGSITGKIVLICND
jgi:NADPH:quinone reductase-like Zn-dependent oxidoreductase